MMDNGWMIIDDDGMRFRALDASFLDVSSIDLLETIISHIAELNPYKTLPLTRLQCNF